MKCTHHFNCCLYGSSSVYFNPYRNDSTKCWVYSAVLIISTTVSQIYAVLKKMFWFHFIGLHWKNSQIKHVVNGNNNNKKKYRWSDACAKQWWHDDESLPMIVLILLMSTRCLPENFQPQLNASWGRVNAVGNMHIVFCFLLWVNYIQV